jgi:hypothetical protein
LRLRFKNPVWTLHTHFLKSQGDHLIVYAVKKTGDLNYRPVKRQFIPAYEKHKESIRIMTID